MRCTAPVIVVCSFSVLWSYSTKLAEKSTWLFLFIQIIHFDLRMCGEVVDAVWH